MELKTNLVFQSGWCDKGKEYCLRVSESEGRGKRQTFFH